jgi:ketosteroid isomerase-like protein
LTPPREALDSKQLSFRRPVRRRRVGMPLAVLLTASAGAAVFWIDARTPAPRPAEPRVLRTADPLPPLAARSPQPSQTADAAATLMAAAESQAPSPMLEPAPAPAPAPVKVNVPAPTPEPVAIKPAGMPPPEAIREALSAWTAAWSNQDMAAYAARYDASFKGRHDTRQAWLDERSARIVGRQGLSVTLSDLNIRLADEEAEVTFIQTYRSKAYSDRSERVVKLRKTADDWLIVEESGR